MSNPTPIKWRFLIVEDKPDIVSQVEKVCADLVAPNLAETEVCQKFKDAIPRLDSRRYDVLVIDLKDDSSELPEDENLPGLEVFAAVKERRFVPVVFYTALPKHVRPMQNAFVRVVEKGPGVAQLRAEIAGIFATGLPALSRHLEDEQRGYMWDFVSTHWREMEEAHDRVDLVYLLARRLARSLQRDAVRKFLNNGSVPGHVAKSTPSDETAPNGSSSEEQDADVVHPIELYIHPGDPEHRFACDIVKEATTNQHWMILTPSCDFEQNNADHVLLAKCELLSARKEYNKWAGKLDKPDLNVTDKFTRLVQDRQLERFKFLPSTFFLPNLLVDFQQLRSVPIGQLTNFTPIASLDSPFAEATLARFARYFGRLGTPDLDAVTVLDRLTATLTKAAATASGPTTAPAAAGPTVTAGEKNKPTPAGAQPSAPQGATAVQAPPPPDNKPQKLEQEPKPAPQPTNRAASVDAPKPPAADKPEKPPTEKGF